MRSILHPLQLALAVVDWLGTPTVRTVCCRLGLHYRVPKGLFGLLDPRRECCNWCGAGVESKRGTETSTEEAPADV